MLLLSHNALFIIADGKSGIIRLLKKGVVKYILSIVPILGLFTGTVLGYSYVSPTPEPQEIRQVIEEPVQATIPEVLSASISAEVEQTPTPKPTIKPTSTPSPTPKILTDEEKSKICDEMVEKFKESKKGDLSKITPELQAKKEEIKKNAEEELKKLNCDRRTSECSQKFQELQSNIRNPKVDGINENEILARFSEEVAKFKYENCPR